MFDFDDLPEWWNDEPMSVYFDESDAESEWERMAEDCLMESYLFGGDA